MLAIRLIRCLPFHYRVKVIEETENVSIFLFRSSVCSLLAKHRPILLIKKPSGTMPLPVPNSTMRQLQIWLIYCCLYTN